MSGCPYLHDDGAYVLGALSPMERARFERHLPTCAACRDAVAELAALPALLGRLTVDDLRLPADDPPAAETDPTRRPEGLLAGLVDAAQGRRRRDQRVARLRSGGVAAAAAAVALAVGLGVGLGWPSAPPERVAQPPSPAPTTASPVALVAMTPLRPGLSVRAEVGLRSGPWGTEVVMHCWYAARAAGQNGPFPYRLVAYGPDRKADPLGSWTSGPGDDVWMSGITQYSISDLTRIQIVGSRGTALLDYEVP
jgi:Putative zinc-finger